MNLYLITHEHVLSMSSNHWCYYIVAAETEEEARAKLEESNVIIGNTEEFRSIEMFDDTNDSQVSFLAYTHEEVDFGRMRSASV